MMRDRQPITAIDLWKWQALGLRYFVDGDNFYQNGRGEVERDMSPDLQHSVGSVVPRQGQLTTGGTCTYLSDMRLA
jgi:hypothetical protein